MNVKFSTKYFLKNYCKYQILPKSLLLKNTCDYKALPTTCECSTFVNLTSKHWFERDEKCNGARTFKQTRFYSEDTTGPPTNKLPSLMPNFPKIVWPSLLKSIRNFILATFIIKPYLDREFSLSDFVTGSKKAVEVISRKLAEGDLKSLEGLVTKDIIPSLQKTIALMSLSQREQLAVNVDDIYFSFPYQVGIMFNDEDKEQKRFVEVTMVYHSLKGLAVMRSRGEEPPLNVGLLPEYQQRISISNYRFIREFSKGVDDDWTVNLLNHFKPIDDQVEK